MLFYKLALFFMLVPFLLWSLFSCVVRFFSLNLNYFFIRGSLLNNLSFGFSFRVLSLSFIMIVRAVTTIVLFYREIYIEHYNNKKFTFLLILFFLSMLLLSVSDRLLLTIVGWDGLGVRSICLIMFYPNSNTLYNSLLTIFFNRLGDVILVAVLCFCLLDFYLFYRVQNLRPWIFLLLLLCSLTKRAQFPLSSWLPAAISAPTPISAIVHSSTLVTAGIFLCLKTYGSLGGLSLLEVLLFIRALSFILGGFIANFELDLKKTIAFSTMSQISIIMVFVSLWLFAIAVCHMMFHALFKTLLFCCAGAAFIANFRDQSSSVRKNFAGGPLILSMSFIRIYGMSGLIFSSSFFSKDLILEYLCRRAHLSIFFTLLFGRVLTLLYCSKICSSLKFFRASSKLTMHKRTYYLFALLFLALGAYANSVTKPFFMHRIAPFITSLELFIILSIFISALWFKLARLSNKLILYLRLRVSFIKTYVYRILNLFARQRLSEFSITDIFFFNSSLYFDNCYSSGVSTFNKSIYLILSFACWYNLV